MKYLSLENKISKFEVDWITRPWTSKNYLNLFLFVIMDPEDFNTPLGVLEVADVGAVFTPVIPTNTLISVGI